MTTPSHLRTVETGMEMTMIPHHHQTTILLPRQVMAPVPRLVWITTATQTLYIKRRRKRSTSATRAIRSI